MAILVRSVWHLQFILPSISSWNKNWSHCSPYCLRTKTNYVVRLRKKGRANYPISIHVQSPNTRTLSLHLCNVKMQCHVSNKRGIKLLPFGTASWKRWRLILYAFILLVKMEQICCSFFIHFRNQVKLPGLWAVCGNEFHFRAIYICWIERWRKAPFKSIEPGRFVD